MTNTYGRQWDDLDTLKAYCHAQQHVLPGQSYSVVSADGVPLCGFVSATAPQPVAVFIDTQFRESPHAD